MCESERLNSAHLEAKGLWGEQQGWGGTRASLHGGQEEGEKRCSSHLAPAWSLRSPHRADMHGSPAGNDGGRRQEILEDEIKQASTTAD